MIPRMLAPPLMLAAAVGVPYVASNGTQMGAILPANSPAASQVEKHADPHDQLLQQLQTQPARPESPQGPGSTLYPAAAPLEGLPTFSLQEVFNFNVTKEWVYQRWARKSTALSELGMFGIRVPLVTGTQLHDLAGSLTYFFDNAGRATRISFRGTTGDTTQLVMLATQQFGLQPQSTPIAGEQLFQMRRQELVFSELRTRPASVLWASSPHDSFAVELDVQRPDVATPLPSRPLPLPPMKEQPSPGSEAAQQSNSEVDPEAARKQAEEQWRTYFPRSRVPKSQVLNLDRRNGMW